MRSFLSLALLLLIAGCSQRIPNADEGAKAGILLLGNGAEPESIDPHLISGHPDANVDHALMEGLIAIHPTDDNLPSPGVAASWERSPDAKTWTFRLNPQARWSNGDPVLASDFLYAHRRVLTASLASEYASMLYLIENAKAYHQGTLSDFSQVGVKALDERTLQYQLESTTPHFLNILKHDVWYPVHPATIEAHGGIASRQSKWTRVGNYVGNGPFVLESWELNKLIKTKRNPHYWDAANVKLNAVYFFPISDIHTENRAFHNGQLHRTYELPSEEVEPSKGTPTYRNDPYLSVYYYMINTTRAPFDDKRVRQALSYAIDRRSITDEVVRRGEQPATSLVPPGFANYSVPPILEYDPEKARALLAAAGYPNGKGFPVKQILYNNHSGHQAIAEAIQQMWRINLNIDVELRNQEWKVYLETRNRMEYDIARAGWGADYMDPDTFLNIWITEEEDSLNDTGWSNPAYDKLLEEGRRSPTQEARYAKFSQAEQLMLDELPCIPIYWYRRPFLLDTRVKGWEPMLLDFHNYKHISFEN